jgi:hypothetical protein
VSSAGIINFAMESARSNGIKVKVVNGDHSHTLAKMMLQIRPYHY